MRVNITYSVELDEIPTAVAGITCQVLEDLKKVEFSLENMGKKLKNDPDIPKALDKMSSLRKDMIKIDFALADSMAILAGYQKTITESYLEEEQKAEVDDVVETD